LWLEESFINLYRSYGWDIFEGIVNLDPNICEALPEKPRTVHMRRDHSHNFASLSQLPRGTKPINQSIL
jgi:hypothetical protein